MARWPTCSASTPSAAAAVRIEDYAETLRGHRVLHLVGKGSMPATMPLTLPVLRVLEACRGQRTQGPLVLRPHSGRPIDRRDVYRSSGRSPRSPPSRDTSARTHCGTPRSLTPSIPESRSATRRSSSATPTRGLLSTTTAPAATSTGTASTSSRLRRRRLTLAGRELAQGALGPPRRMRHQTEGASRRPRGFPAPGG